MNHLMLLFNFRCSQFCLNYNEVIKVLFIVEFGRGRCQLPFVVGIDIRVFPRGGLTGDPLSPAN